MKSLSIVWMNPLSPCHGIQHHKPASPNNTGTNHLYYLQKKTDISDRWHHNDYLLMVDPGAPIHCCVEYPVAHTNTLQVRHRRRFSESKCSMSNPLSLFTLPSLSYSWTLCQKNYCVVTLHLSWSKVISITCFILKRKMQTCNGGLHRSLKSY